MKYTELKQLGVSDRLCDILKKHSSPKFVEQRYQYVLQKNISVVLHKDPEYPPLLKQLADPPPVLYFFGSLKSCTATCVTVVGSRAHSSYGKNVTAHIVPELVSAGMTIISGLALGIDTLAHRCATSQGKPTIAFLGSGIDTISPRSNIGLAHSIIEHGGAIISEFFPGTPAYPAHFPRRNRLLAGISKATLLIEASSKSGSLITARYALEANRDVFVVPGSIFSPLSSGINHLLYEGAHPITSANDLLSHYNITATVDSKSLEALTDVQKTLLGTLVNGPLHIDKIARISTLDISVVHSELSILELDGYIRLTDNQTYCQNF